MLVSGAAGLAVATGAGTRQCRPAVCAMAALVGQSTSVGALRSRHASTRSVTVPDLPTTEAPPVPPPATSDPGTARTEPAPGAEP